MLLMSCGNGRAELSTLDKDKHTYCVVIYKPRKNMILMFLVGI